VVLSTRFATRTPESRGEEITKVSERRVGGEGKEGIKRPIAGPELMSLENAGGQRAESATRGGRETSSPTEEKWEGRCDNKGVGRNLKSRVAGDENSKK